MQANNTNNNMYASGLTLDIFPSMEFESLEPNVDPLENSETLLQQTRNLLRLLMGGWRADWPSLLNHRVYKAVFIARDYEFTQALRLAFQQGFQHIFTQLENQVLPPLQHNQAQLYISNCLCYLPYADMSPYESIAIPQYINHQWVMVDYKVNPIELTPQSGLKKLFLSDYDRVFAYGLEPINQLDAQAHLIFMGTTYPAGQGFVSTVETDLEAFETAGKQLYRSGRRSIINWLNQQPKKPHVCGTSLGGALSLLLVIDQGDKIERVDALNPPGLYRPLRKSRFDRWEQFDAAEKPLVYIQKQQHDPVSKFGEWKLDWRILSVIPPDNKKGPSSVFAHDLNYAGFAETTFIDIDTAQDNQERKLRNFWVYGLLRGITYYLLIAPLRYLVLSTVRFILSKQGLYTIAASILTLFCAVSLPLMATLIIATVLALPMLAYIGLKLPNIFSTLFGLNPVTLPKSQDPTLPRNEILDIYSHANEIEARFSYREIADYYQAQRVVLKDKPYLPEEKSNMNFKNTGYTKRDILENAEKPELSEQQITIKATKAKIHDMRKVIHLTQQIGFHAENRTRLRDELAINRESYLIGKPLSIKPA